MNRDALVDLTANAVGYGVMMALEGRDDLIRKLQAAGPNATMFDAVRADAEGFLNTRSDLVEALGVSQ